MSEAAVSLLAPEALARMIDHTLLKPDATGVDIDRLCAEAHEHGFCSVCVNPVHVTRAARALADSPVKVCTVVGFPLGASVSRIKVEETRQAIADGAHEIDMVLNIGALKAGDDDVVRRDIADVAQACRVGGALLKVIFETVLLSDAEKVRACRICVEAGAGFVKTSTGFAAAGATVPDVELMARAVAAAGLGVKAAGGIRTYDDAVRMVAAGATRLGASAGARILEEARARSAGRATVPPLPPAGQGGY